MTPTEEEFTFAVEKYVQSEQDKAGITRLDILLARMTQSDEPIEVDVIDGYLVNFLNENGMNNQKICMAYYNITEKLQSDFPNFCEHLQVKFFVERAELPNVYSACVLTSCFVAGKGTLTKDLLAMRPEIATSESPYYVSLLLKVSDLSDEELIVALNQISLEKRKSAFDCRALKKRLGYDFVEKLIHAETVN